MIAEQHIVAPTAEEALAHAQTELRRLYAALDNVDSGLLILDRDLRVLYLNPVLYRIFGIARPEEIFGREPAYEEFLRAAHSVCAVDLEDYIERRLAWVRSGDLRPMDLNMSSGKVIRCHLSVLPDGGRMLTYSDVTDLVEQARELERLATTDALTGLFNRRHFLALAEMEWMRARRYGRPLSFLMLDIDHFKTINDSFGHIVGDQAIVHLTHIWRERRRSSDVVARIGGEEFGVLLPETDREGAVRVAERLRLDAAASPLSLPESVIRATVSIGVASCSALTPAFSSLMEAADRALYKAKRLGRNRVVVENAPAAA
ncbi:GGDEF domain-containing protein [Methylocystis sp. S23]|jgi:diguanylate cyclase (GGDEF)-like protein